ncbi:MAG: hypothetical protein OEU97_00050 [Dehalococcoidia bacterium]|nr:hypothetical protein [Dehalococcoidia bacterium]MDH4299435.1 hypothetical protein [Dehalococcoidia bacterium]MDH4366622.1 hypothetical protein [Dehalococcoidia bacterium]
MEQIADAISATVFLGWSAQALKVTRKEVGDDIFAKYLQRIPAGIS